MSWFSGYSYFAFSEYRIDHLRHHSERVDLIGMDIVGFLSRHKFLKIIFLLLERLYIPCLHFVIKINSIFDLMLTGDYKVKFRTIVAIFLNLSFVIIIFLINHLSVIFFFLAIVFRIHCIRFVDCFQHCYEQIEPHEQRKNTKEYENKFTFSFPVAKKYSFLNWIILNFGFHEAHHYMPSCPWYKLSALDSELRSRGILHKKMDGDSMSLPMLLYWYNKNMIIRLLSRNEGHPYDTQDNFSIKSFHGAFTDHLLG